jgi:hypothetical protein
MVQKTFQASITVIFSTIYIFTWNFCALTLTWNADGSVLICACRIICVMQRWNFTLFSSRSSRLTFHSSSAKNSMKRGVIRVLWCLQSAMTIEFSKRTQNRYLVTLLVLWLHSELLTLLQYSLGVIFELWICMISLSPTMNCDLV